MKGQAWSWDAGQITFGGSEKKKASTNKLKFFRIPTWLIQISLEGFRDVYGLGFDSPIIPWVGIVVTSACWSNVAFFLIPGCKAQVFLSSGSRWTNRVPDSRSITGTTGHTTMPSDRVTSSGDVRFLDKNKHLSKHRPHQHMLEISIFRVIHNTTT